MNLFYKEKLCEVLQKNNVDAILIAPGEELEFILATQHISANVFRLCLSKQTANISMSATS
ncbi:MAG: hypothetical protein IKA10_01000 [Oscillospiraceae bacterium]|nr:hypothetical protein [Oscillospiraceae bacterium]